MFASRDRRKRTDDLDERAGEVLAELRVATRHLDAAVEKVRRVAEEERRDPDG